MAPWPPKTLHQGEAGTCGFWGPPRDLSQRRTCSAASVLSGTRYLAPAPRPPPGLPYVYPLGLRGDGGGRNGAIQSLEAWLVARYQRTVAGPHADGQEDGGDGRRGVETLFPSKVTFTGPTRVDTSFGGHRFSSPVVMFEVSTHPWIGKLGHRDGKLLPRASRRGAGLLHLLGVDSGPAGEGTSVFCCRLQRLWVEGRAEVKRVMILARGRRGWCPRLCRALQARQVGEETEVEKDDGGQGPPDGWQWRLAFLWVSGW
ncbi:unnamed protein product [Rangifer tarandus platyrhynchus]|uniref:Uncharacterized protein n=1 Tax=Rangifer tarandus platyrhynchus TaxID=3082113 RepID=A0ABN8XZE7_RANTA|nr:unnamed protein product [Rangifer tarandus platyrhynchus]